jgi:hypothetical protein
MLGEGRPSIRWTRPGDNPPLLVPEEPNALELAWDAVHEGLHAHLVSSRGYAAMSLATSSSTP